MTSRYSSIPAPPLSNRWQEHWNLAVQQELLPNTVLEIDYVGNKGTHLAGTTAINNPPAGVGGITQARKIAAMAEAYSVPVIPHAGQMHNFHIVMASLNSPMAEYLPIVDVEIGNELFW